MRFKRFTNTARSLKCLALALASTLGATTLSSASNQQSFLELDGVSQHAVVPAASAPDFADRSFTIEFWCKRDNARRTEWIFGQGDGTSNNGLHIGFRGDGRFSFSFWDNDLNIPTSNDAGIWVHWACTYDAQRGIRRIYRNGNPVPFAEDPALVPRYSGSGDLLIGARPQGGASFDGALSSIRIWSTALSGNSIANRFNRDLIAEEMNQASVQAVYPGSALADQGVGQPGANDLTDISSHARHADAVGNPSSTTHRPHLDADATPDVTHVVSNLDPSGPGSLHQTIADAISNDADNGPLIQKISFADGLTGTVNLTAPLPPITAPLLIEGPGAHLLTIDGGLSRPFDVHAGLVLRHLSITNCRHTGTSGAVRIGGGAGYGGALVVHPFTNAHVEHVVFHNNSAIGGNGGDAGSNGSNGQAGGTYQQRYVCELMVAGVCIRGSYQETHRRSPIRFNSNDGRNGASGAHASAASHSFAFHGGGTGGTGGGGKGGEAIWWGSGGGGSGGRGGNGGSGGIGGYGAGGGGAGGAGGGGGGGTDNHYDDVDHGKEHGFRGAPGSGKPGGIGGFGGGDGGGSSSGGYGGGKVRSSDIVGARDNGYGGGAGGKSGPAGGGAGMGGAIFVASKANLSLYDVTFFRNTAEGGRAGTEGNENASPGRGLGSAVFLMQGSVLQESAGLSFAGNNNNTYNGDDALVPDVPDPVFSSPLSPAFELRAGTSGTPLPPLYYHDAENASPGSSSNATFRYRWNLFALTDHDANSATDDVPTFQFPLDSPNEGTPNDPDPTSVFSAADEQDANSAMQATLDAITADPQDRELHELALDIAHDTAAILGFLAKHRANQAERDAVLVDPLLQSDINSHIDAYAPSPDHSTDSALDRYRRALDAFAPVLGESRIFTHLTEVSAVRYFSPLTYIDPGHPDPQVVSPESQSIGGYADLTFIYDLLANYGEAATRLALLLHSRDLVPIGDIPGDREFGINIARETGRYLYTTGLVLNPLVPTNPPADLGAAIGRWQQTMANLEEAQTRLASGVNSLGFPDQFLLLSGDHEGKDSFDFFRDHVSADEDDPGTASDGALTAARKALDNALDGFESYNQTRETYATSRGDAIGSLESRLTELGDAEGENPSGEILEQFLRVANARETITLNKIAIDNLHAEIQIQTERTAELQDNNLNIANIKVNYLNKQRDLDKEIGKVEAAQEAAQTATNFFLSPPDPLTTFQKVVKVVNFGVQVAAEAKKSELEDQKVELAGAEIVELAGADNAALDIELQSFIKTRLLDMKRLSVESLIAANSFRIELNRLASLYNEKERIEERLGNIDEVIAGRYFADPLHLQRFESANTGATLRFERAKAWMFIVLKALEYKWNEPFFWDGYSASDIYAARNATQLKTVFDKMVELDNDRLLDPDYQPNEPTTIAFSLRKFFYNYLEIPGAVYDDPLGSGNSVDAFEAFRAELKRLADTTTDGSQVGQIIVPFDTVRALTTFNNIDNAGPFFAGAKYSYDANNDCYRRSENGFSLDKINWVKVQVRGDLGSGFNVSKITPSNINFGGTTYVRRVRVGQPAPGRPDQLNDEIIPFETFKYSSGNTFPPVEIDPKDNIIQDSIDVAISNQPTGSPNIEPGASFASSKFADRSVAASDWKLSFFAKQGFFNLPLDKVDDIIIYINHRYADRDTTGIPDCIPASE